MSQVRRWLFILDPLKHIFGISPLKAPVYRCGTGDSEAGFDFFRTMQVCGRFWTCSWTSRSCRIPGSLPSILGCLPFYPLATSGKAPSWIKSRAKDVCGFSPSGSPEAVVLPWVGLGNSGGETRAIVLSPWDPFTYLIHQPKSY